MHDSFILLTQKNKLGGYCLRNIITSSSAMAGEFSEYEVREGEARVSESTLATTNLRSCTAIALHLKSKNKEFNQVFLAHVSHFVTRKRLVQVIQDFLASCPDGELSVAYWHGLNAKIEFENNRTDKIVEDALSYVLSLNKKTLRQKYRKNYVHHHDTVSITVEGSFQVHLPLFNKPQTTCFDEEDDGDNLASIMDFSSDTDELDAADCEQEKNSYPGSPLRSRYGSFYTHPTFEDGDQTILCEDNWGNAP